ELAVAAQAVVLQDAAVSGLDADRLLEDELRARLVGVRGLEGEPRRVVIPVERLGDVLGREPGRHVAVVAGGEGVVRALAPGVVPVAHDVAVDARRRVVAQVREALGVTEGGHADADHRAEKNAEQDGTGAHLASAGAFLGTGILNVQAAWHFCPQPPRSFQLDGPAELLIYFRSHFSKTAVSSAVEKRRSWIGTP